MRQKEFLVPLEVVNCHLLEGTENNKEKGGGEAEEEEEEEEECYGNL